ncbi:MAG: type II toxin-antitoxin system prevent-host-death family antitoxin [Pseudomonadota bacterium]
MRSKSRDTTELPPEQISAFEMQRRPAVFQRRVLEHPLTITSNGEPTIVAMSVSEYRRLQARARAALRVEELADDDLDAIAKTEAAPEAYAFDDEDPRA